MLVKNKKGKVEKIVMEDGYTITNEYDENDNIVRVFSSDMKFETIYHRDELGDIYSVTINGQTFNAKYNGDD